MVRFRSLSTINQKKNPKKPKKPRAGDNPGSLFKHDRDLTITTVVSTNNHQRITTGLLVLDYLATMFKAQNNLQIWRKWACMAKKKYVQWTGERHTFMQKQPARTGPTGFNGVSRMVS